jgi:hypothetical protein
MGRRRGAVGGVRGQGLRVDSLGWWGLPGAGCGSGAGVRGEGDGGAACYAFDGCWWGGGTENENSHQSITTEAIDSPGTSTRPRASEPAAGPDEIVGNKKSDKYIDVNGSCG